MTPRAIEGLEAVAIAALVIHGAIRSTTVRQVVTAPARRRRRHVAAKRRIGADVAPDPPVLLESGHAPSPPELVDQADRFPPTLAGLARELSERNRR